MCDQSVPKFHVFVDLNDKKSCFCGDKIWNSLVLILRITIKMTRAIKLMRYLRTKFLFYIVYITLVNVYVDLLVFTRIVSIS